jgi:hypothetical protein
MESVGILGDQRKSLHQDARIDRVTSETYQPQPNGPHQMRPNATENHSLHPELGDWTADLESVGSGHTRVVRMSLQKIQSP